MKDLSLSLTYRKLVEIPFSSEANVYVAALLQEAMVKYNDPDRIRISGGREQAGEDYSW